MSRVTQSGLYFTKSEKQIFPVILKTEQRLPIIVGTNPRRYYYQCRRLGRKTGRSVFKCASSALFLCIGERKLLP